MTKVVMYTLEGTSSDAGIFFPDTFKANLEHHVKNGEIAIICSCVTPREVIMQALADLKIETQAEVIVGLAQIHGADEMKAMACYRKTADEDLKVTADDVRKFNLMEKVMREKDMSAGIFVDGSATLNAMLPDHGGSLIQIMPRKSLLKTDAPDSDDYLRCALLPILTLRTYVQSFVRVVAQIAVHFPLDHDPLLVAYDKALKAPDVLKNLTKYRTDRINDQREYKGFWASWSCNPNRTRTAKLIAVDQLIDGVRNGTLKLDQLPAATYNGELSTIIKTFR